MSPSSCVRCSKPVAILSPAGLCPQCAATDSTCDPTIPALPPTAADAPDADATRTAPPPGTTASDRPAAGPAPVPYAPAGYDLLDHLGSGGMGTVYLAREQAAERVVAMKFLRHPADPDAAARFLVELQVLAALDHPNIVRVLASDFLRAEPFFTMEHLPGGPLSRALDPKTPAPVAEAVRLVRLVTGAVAVAHAQGVIHRDLKPSNILLAADGTPKVADFGLAKRLKRDDQLSASGALGTAGYMPPEQVSRKNGEIGTWSDVYGLGATLYHLLVGRPPFVGETPAATILQVLADPPARLRALRPEIPKELEGIVLKCLEKDPKDRYLTAAELGADLDRFAAGQKPVAPPLTRWRRAKQWARRNRRGLIASGLAAVLVAGVALGVAFWPKPPTPLEEQQQLLGAGQPVVLIGATEGPKYYRWAFGAPELVSAAHHDGAVEFETTTYGLLELCPDPMSDHYRFEAEVRFLNTKADRKNVKAAAGIYFGHAELHGANFTRADTFVTLEFADYPVLDDPPGKNAELRASLLIETKAGASPNQKSFPGVKVKQSPQLPGPWRRFEVEVDNGGVKAFVTDHKGEKHPLKEQPRAAIAVKFTDLSRENNLPAGHGIVMPEWRPRMPLGIWSNLATVAVRNAKLTPLK